MPEKEGPIKQVALLNRRALDLGIVLFIGNMVLGEWVKHNGDAIAPNYLFLESPIWEPLGGYLWPHEQVGDQVVPLTYKESSRTRDVEVRHEKGGLALPDKE